MTKEILIELVIIKNLSNREIAKYYDVHYNTVGKWLKKFKISVKTPKHIHCAICVKKLKNNTGNRSICTSCSIRILRYRNKQKAIRYKGGCCSRCGYSDSMGALQFHHTGATKNFTIGNKITLPWSKLKRELNKCILLCANCHSQEHTKQEEPLLQAYIDRASGRIRTDVDRTLEIPVKPLNY